MADFKTDSMRFEAYAGAVRLGRSERCLWHMIRYLFEKADNPRRLAIRNGTIKEYLGWADYTIANARRELIRHRLIRWDWENGGFALYMMREVPDPDEVRYGLREGG